MRDNQIQQFYQIGGASGSYGPLYRRGRHIQVGRGIGTGLRFIWRFLSPYLASGLKSISGEALRSGAEILSEIDSAPIRDLLVKQRDKSLRNLANQAGEKLMTMNQRGRGLQMYKRKRVDFDSLSPLPKRRRATSSKRKVRKPVKRKGGKPKKGKKKKKKSVKKKKPVKRKATKKRKKSNTKKVQFDKESFLNKFIN